MGMKEINHKIAREMRTAFAEISSGINRIGSALAELLQGADESYESSISQINPNISIQNLEKSSASTSSDTLTTPVSAKSPKIKEPKDPNAPKRPMSTFLLFAKENRDRIMRENPQLSYLEASKLLGQLWEKADKKPYEEKCNRLMEIYKKEMEDYLGKQKAPGIVEEPLEKVVSAEPEKMKSKKRKSDKNETDPKDIQGSVGISETFSSISNSKKSKNKVDEPKMNTLPTENEFVGDKGPLVSFTAATTASSLDTLKSSEQTPSAPKKKKKNKENKEKQIVAN